MSQQAGREPRSPPSHFSWRFFQSILGTADSLATSSLAALYVLICLRQTKPDQMSGILLKKHKMKWIKKAGVKYIRCSGALPCSQGPRGVLNNGFWSAGRYLGRTLHSLAHATAEWISFWTALGTLGKAVGNERSDR